MFAIALHRENFLKVLLYIMYVYSVSIYYVCTGSQLDLGGDVRK